MPPTTAQRGRVHGYLPAITISCPRRCMRPLLPKLFHAYADGLVVQRALPLSLEVPTRPARPELPRLRREQRLSAATSDGAERYSF